MADPITAISLGATVGGSLLSASGAQQSGQAQAGMYNYQAGVADLNSKIALQNRDLALASGQSESERYGMQAAQRLGAIRAGNSASGIDVGSGSKADVVKGQQYVTGIDQATIYNNAARRAYGFEVESATDVAQAGAYSKAAVDAKSAGDIKAMASLVSGVGSVASKWTQGSSSGMFKGGSIDLSGWGFNPIAGATGGGR